MCSQSGPWSFLYEFSLWDEFILVIIVSVSNFCCLSRQVTSELVFSQSASYFQYFEYFLLRILKEDPYLFIFFFLKSGCRLSPSINHNFLVLAFINSVIQFRNPSIANVVKFFKAGKFNKIFWHSSNLSHKHRPFQLNLAEKNLNSLTVKLL